MLCVEAKNKESTGESSSLGAPRKEVIDRQVAIQNLNGLGGGMILQVPTIM